MSVIGSAQHALSLELGAGAEAFLVHLERHRDQPVAGVGVGAVGDPERNVAAHRRGGLAGVEQRKIGPVETDRFGVDRIVPQGVDDAGAPIVLEGALQRLGPVVAAQDGARVRAVPPIADRVIDVDRRDRDVSGQRARSVAQDHAGDGRADGVGSQGLDLRGLADFLRRRIAYRGKRRERAGRVRCAMGGFGGAHRDIGRRAERAAGYRTDGKDRGAARMALLHAVVDDIENAGRPHSGARRASGYRDNDGLHGAAARRTSRGPGLEQGAQRRAAGRRHGARIVDHPDRVQVHDHGRGSHEDQQQGQYRDAVKLDRHPVDLLAPRGAIHRIGDGAQRRDQHREQQERYRRARQPIRQGDLCEDGAVQERRQGAQDEQRAAGGE